MITKEMIWRIMAIRKVELAVTKNFNKLGGENHKITFSDATRFLLKHCPDTMDKIDKILDNEKE